MHASTDHDLPAICSVTHMAAKVGLSRARFYQLVEAAVLKALERLPAAWSAASTLPRRSCNWPAWIFLQPCRAGASPPC